MHPDNWDDITEELKRAKRRILTAFAVMDSEIIALRKENHELQFKLKVKKQNDL